MCNYDNGAIKYEKIDSYNKFKKGDIISWRGVRACKGICISVYWEQSPKYSGDSVLYNVEQEFQEVPIADIYFFDENEILPMCLNDPYVLKNMINLSKQRRERNVQNTTKRV